MESQFCRLSRMANRSLTGRDEPICASAARSDGWLKLALDLTLYWYDGPDHCIRMRALYESAGACPACSPREFRRAGASG